MTLQQRRDKIAIAKKNSTCRLCHKPGHWAAECPEKKHHSHGKPKPFKKKLRGYLSTVETDSDESSDEVLAHVAVSSSTAPVLRRDVAPTSRRGVVPTSKNAVPASRDNAPLSPRGTVPVALRANVSSPRVKSELTFASPVAVEVAVPALNNGRRTASSSRRSGPRRINENNPLIIDYESDDDEYIHVANMHVSFPDNDPTEEEEDVDQAMLPVFKFGQYKDHTFKDVAEHESSYFFWAKDQKNPSMILRKFIDWVEINYTIDLDN